MSPESVKHQDERDWLDGVVFSARKAHSFFGRGKKALRNELEAPPVDSPPSSSPAAAASSQQLVHAPVVGKAKPETKEAKKPRGAPSKKDPSDPNGLLKLFSQQRA